MRSVAIGAAVLGLVIVLGSQLPQVGEAVQRRGPQVR